MKTITVNASKSYDVLIGSNLLSSLGHYLDNVKKACKVCVISDSNVFPFYGDNVINSLRQSGYEVISFVFSAGEASKNHNTYLDILNFLAQNQLSRTDCLIALGGGVVGDITGFAAATYLRGISYVQIPTSLLAMVDSSVGGKTAIDLPAGKNLVGAFYQPELVLCDIDALNTLPADYFRDGCAEVIKYAVLYDPILFQHLLTHGLEFSREEVIACCIDWKRKVVAEDEFDTGARQKLNLGHTIGHSVEAISNYSISHGMAVSIGMAIISRAAFSLGLCNETDCVRIQSVLEAFHLPIGIDYTSSELYRYALSDKKRNGSTVNLIVPRAVGNCSIISVPISELESFIKAGLL